MDEEKLPNNIIYSSEYQAHLEHEIYQQYARLENLGINIIKQNNLTVRPTNHIEPQIFTNLLLFFNTNYSPIINIDNILNNEDSIIWIGDMIYSFISEDLINQILPQTFKKLGLKDCKSLTFEEDEDLMSSILNVIGNYQNNLLKITQNANHTELNFELEKWTFYIDLLSNNFDNFKQNLLLPLIIKYDVDINSQIN